MTNFALEQAFERSPFRSRVQRWATATCWRSLRSRGWQLGGENSGHIICLDKHTTGDGIVSGAAGAACAAREPAAAGAARCRAARLYPQVLVNVRLERGGMDPRKDPQVQAAVQVGEASLAGRGRVLLRPSGHRAGDPGDGRGRVRTTWSRRLAESIADTIRQQAAA